MARYVRQSYHDEYREGGWVIPHFILTKSILRFPPDSRGMCREMLCSGISTKEGLGYIRIPKIFKNTLRLWIDNQNSMGYTLSKIKDKETPQMTKSYKIAEEIAKEIVKTRNAKYKALKEKDLESYDKFNALSMSLEEALERFGYRVFLEYGDSPMLLREGRVAFEVIGASISEVLK